MFQFENKLKIYLQLFFGLILALQLLACAKVSFDVDQPALPSEVSEDGLSTSGATDTIPGVGTVLAGSTGSTLGCTGGQVDFRGTCVYPSSDLCPYSFIKNGDCAPAYFCQMGEVEADPLDDFYLEYKLSNPDVNEFMEASASMLFIRRLYVRSGIVVAESTAVNFTNMKKSSVETLRLRTVIPENFLMSRDEMIITGFFADKTNNSSRNLTFCITPASATLGTSGATAELSEAQPLSRPRRVSQTK